MWWYILIVLFIYTVEITTLLSELYVSKPARKWSVKEAGSAQIRPKNFSKPHRPLSCIPLGIQTNDRRIRTFDDIRIRLNDEQLSEFRSCMIAAFKKVNI